MTQSTEQERAEFEAWWRGYTKSNKAPRFEGGAYIFPAANTAWNTWQAARRAPAVPTRKQIEQYLYEQGAVTVSRDVAEAAGLARLAGKMQSAPAAPVPQGWKLVPMEPTECMEQAAADYLDACVRAHGLWLAMLAAAPQPPGACTCPSGDGSLRWPCPQHPPEAAPVQLPAYGIDTANHAGVRVRGYTEQQVRQLLAAHGIQEQST